MDFFYENPVTSMRDITYLQREHAVMINSLHEEIEIMKHKCKKLSFELIMRGDKDGEGKYLIIYSMLRL